MTRKDAQQLRDLLARLSEDERRALRDELDRALTDEKTDPRGKHAMSTQPAADVITDQHRAMREIRQALAGRFGDDPYADLGHSNDAHDKILYDLEQ